MPRAFDKQSRQEIGAPSNSTVGITVICWALVLTFVALTSNSPAVSNWVSNAAQAEFADAIVPDVAPARVTERARTIQTVRAY